VEFEEELEGIGDHRGQISNSVGYGCRIGIIERCIFLEIKIMQLSLEEFAALLR